MIYLIGSLRNPKVPEIAKRLREEGIEVFAEWFAAGPEADDYWKAYEQSQGYTYIEALSRPAAKNVFAFDRTNLDRSSAVVLVLPAGRSGHLELGYGIGSGKPGYILLDDPDRWDVMYQFATGLYTDIEPLISELKKPITPVEPYLVWVDVNNPANTGKVKNPSDTSADKLPKEFRQNYGLCTICCKPSTIGSHADCGRDTRHSGGNRALSWSERAILKALDKK